MKYIKFTGFPPLRGFQPAREVKCPVCGRVFEIEDIHRPIYCSRCGTLFEIWFRSARVLLSVSDEVDKGGGE